MLITDYVIVVDIEATCWQDQIVPEGSHIDIIEIGICKLFISNGEIAENQSIYVIPERSEISLFCSELTGITNEIIRSEGISYGEACLKIINEYQPSGRVWASYGDFDRNIIQNQCDNQSIDYPLGRTHINVKSLFALKKKLKRAKGMNNALNIINEPLEGRHHSGSDDAFNIAKILRWILNN